MMKRGNSGLMISTATSGRSAPVTALGPWTSRRNTRGSPLGTWMTSFLRFRSTSTVPSVTPGIGVSTLRTPSIFTQDTAAPGTMESSVRRRELPTVSA